LYIEGFDISREMTPHLMESITAGDHLINCLGLGPPLNDDPICSSHGAGPIGAVLAMKEEGEDARVLYHGQKPYRRLIINPPSIGGDFDVVEFIRKSRGFDLISVGVESPEGDNGPYPHLLQCLESVWRGLGAAIETGGYPVEIGDPVCLQRDGPVSGPALRRSGFGAR
jgi:hypothetical protein